MKTKTVNKSKVDAEDAREIAAGKPPTRAEERREASGSKKKKPAKSYARGY